MINSFTTQWNMVLLIKPVRFNSRYNLPAFIDRVNLDMQSVLLVLPSNYKGWNKVTNSYSVDMGLSLSSTRKIPRGETVSWFNGEVLSVKSKKFNDRVKAGHNKYMLGLGDFFVTVIQI